jgi:hypothetical protein
MRTLGLIALGIVIGVGGLIFVQHPRTIEVLGAALGVTTSAPNIKDFKEYPNPAWCAANPQAECR